MRLLALGLAVIALSGCLTSGPSPATSNQEASAPPAGPPAVVVADIGPGVNPYHEIFRRPDWTQPPWERIPTLWSNVTLLNLTLGDDYGASRQADEAIWAAYTPGTLYWVPGTNLLIFTHRPFDWKPDGGPKTFHGTGSAGSVVDGCPECYVLAFQDARSIDGRALDFVTKNMPWVDLAVSTNIPGPYMPLGARHAQATRRFWDQGRLFVSFSGNSPATGIVGATAPFPIMEIDLPPWVVDVGGAHAECGSTQLLAGKPPEFVGDFTRRLAWSETVHDYEWNAGTSFSTPQVAGAFGRALHTVRATLGHGDATGALWRGEPAGDGLLADGELSPADLRAAMAASARYFTTASYDPAKCPAVTVWPAPAMPLTPTPASPTPWIDMGWGYAAAPEGALAGQILLGEATAPAKPAEASEWMSAYMAARAAMYPW